MRIVLLVCLLLTSLGRAEEPPAKPSEKPPEWFEMFVSILFRPDDIMVGKGWFHPAQTRFTWHRFAERYDSNRDGRVTAEEFGGKKEMFTRLDRDGDGVVAPNDFDWSDQSPYMQQYSFARGLLRRNDANQDGIISEEEWLAIYKQLSSQGQPVDIEKLRRFLYPPRPAMPQGKQPPSEDPSQWTLLKGLWRSEVGSLYEGPNLNTVAPDFKLETQDGKQTIELKNLIGKKPIVLVFGNYTCGPFRVTYGSVEELRKRYSDEIEFVSVYVREAHPTDGWRMSFNDRSGVSLPQPRNKSERTKVASECSTALKMTMPLLVDDVDDKVGNLYSGMPSRLYLIDTDGKVAYKSGRGPFGFKPAELEQAILIHLAESTPTGKKSSLPRPSNEEAWKLLPEVANGGNQPIPIWIRTLAKSLPRTAAVMFELDAVQRTRSSLVPEWRALVRMRIAELHRCEHARLEALGDFHRLQKQSPAEYQQSLTATELSQLKKVMTFAEQLSRDGSKVEDAQVAELLKFLGNDRLTALVHVVAYANFQDRLLHSLGLASETPLETAPQEIRFKRPWVGGVTRERMLPPDRPKSVSEIDLAWKGVSYEQLQKSLEDQRCREGRIAVPAFDEMKKRLPAYYPTPTRPSRVKWSLVSLGYAPELSANWLIGLRTFGEESKQDRIFEELLFWVITREISCFY